MSDGEFVRSLPPAAVVAGIVHLVGVVAGLRTRAEDRRELALRAWRVRNASSACACITPVVGLVRSAASCPRCVRRCGPGCVSVPDSRHACSQRGRDIGGRGAAGMLAMAGALLVGLFAMPTN